MFRRSEKALPDFRLKQDEVGVFPLDRLLSLRLLPLLFIQRLNPSFFKCLFHFTNKPASCIRTDFQLTWRGGLSRIF